MDDHRGDFDDFVRSSLPSLSRAAYALTSDVHTAQDLVQETHIRMAKHWQRLSKQSEDPFAYARKILYRLWQDSLRWRARHPERLGETPEPRVDSDATDPSERISLRLSLRQLSRLQRAVLVLRYLEDQTEVETARILDCTVGTVQSQARRGLATLRTRHHDPDHELPSGRASA